MIECPYCYKAVKPQDAVCGNCGKPIERWQTGFYSRQELPAKSRTAVWVGAVVLFLLVVLGFARSCHWF
jgi:predicted amidophosphoribosyltransferase